MTKLAFLTGTKDSLPRVCGVLGMSIAIIVLISWVLNFFRFEVSSILISANPLVALEILLISAYFISRKSKLFFIRHQITFYIFAIIILIPLLGVLSDEIFNTRFYFDRILVSKPVLQGTVAPVTTVSLILLVVAMVTARSSNSRMVIVSQLLALTVLYLSLLFNYTYFYNSASMFTNGKVAPMSVPTFLALIFLSVGVLAIHRSEGFLKQLFSSFIGGVTARKALPWLLFVPLVVGYFRLVGQKLGWYPVEFGTALFSITVLFLSVLLVWYYARMMNSFDENRTKFERELALSESKFSKAFTHSGIGIAIVSLDGVWMDVNPSLCEILGYSKDEMLEMDFQRMTHREDLDADLGNLQRALDEEQDNYQMEKRFMHKEGHIIWTKMNVSIVREDGVAKFFVTQLTEITAIKSLIDSLKQKNIELIKAKEEAERATLVKTEFLSMMSHEIRTPMNAVIGFTHLLLEDPKEDQLEYIKLLKFSGENLLVLINDILDFNKIEAGKIEFEDSDFNFRELLQNVSGALAAKAHEKGISLQVLIDDDLPDLVVGDSVRLGQVLTNLVSNAVKFTEKGRVTLTSSLITEDEHHTVVSFEVKDTGIGIAPEKQKAIFDSFTQANSDTTRKYGGTGLGLAISKRLLELQNSEISLESEPGIGSSFFFELRFKKSSKTMLRTVHTPAEEKETLKDLRVLLAEDNKINVVLATQFLRKWEIQYDVAENGLQAVDMVKRKTYDLILMDLQMPEMDGYEAARVIRGLSDIQFCKIPIIALSAEAMSDVKEKVLANGMNDLITKPFNPQDLAAKLRSYRRKAVELLAC